MTSALSPAPSFDGGEVEAEEILGESRPPMAAAVLATMVLTQLLPDDLRLGPSWGLLSVEGLLPVALLLGDPGGIDRRSNALRTLSIGLVALLVFNSVRATSAHQLISSFFSGRPETNSVSALLSAGGTVWVSTIIAFARLHWKMDGGGAAPHAYLPRRPDFAFPRRLNPALAPTTRRPKFIDHPYLGSTDSTALGHADVMPLAARAKIPMARPVSDSLIMPAAENLLR